MDKLAKHPEQYTLTFVRTIVLVSFSIISGCTNIITNLPIPKLDILESSPIKPVLNIFPVDYSEVPGWKRDDLSETLPVLIRSCGKIKNLDKNKPLGEHSQMGRVSDWLPICNAAQMIRPGNETEARYFYESRFLPYTVANNQNRQGLFTGYYEAELHGAFGPDARYRYPILARPKDIINVDLVVFKEKYRDSKISGRIEGNILVPYYTRAEIEDGALKGRKLETMWVDSAIDAFVLHIQGSGRILLPDGSYVRVGFDGRNGHRYTSIGRELVASGAMRLKDVTMPAIRQWMENNPVSAIDLMRKNKSFIFFKVSKDSGPVGAQGVVLTANRSLAVDRDYYPMGIPIWLDTTVPGSREKMQRLVITQDTGSAIKGPVRGDFFWGNGPQAEINAGIMKQKGEMYLLLPKTAAQTLLTN